MAEYTASDFNPTIISDSLLEENNVRIIDPNPLGQTVPPEDLFIYVKLKARQKTKSVITEGINKNRVANDIVLNVPQKTIETVAGNKLFKPKDQLTTDWTEIGGHLLTGQKLYQDLEGFGITNIDIEIKSQTSPKVVIDFIDVRGATLFEQGSCSPYGLFFNMPYPIFELTVKGYYGKPVNYYLNLVKFNAKFNSDTGNMECRAEFLGYTFAFLADIIVFYVQASMYLREDTWQPQKKLRQKYIATKSYYTQDDPDGPDNNPQPWCDNPKIGNRCTTIFDLLTFLDSFDEDEKPNIVGTTEYKDVTDLTQLELKYKGYRDAVYNLIHELTDANYQFTSSTSDLKGPSKFIFSDDEVKKLTLSGGTISSYFDQSNGSFKTVIKDVLTFKVNGKNVYGDLGGEYNIKCGTSKPEQFEKESPTYNLYDSDFFKNNNWASSKIKDKLGLTSPTNPQDTADDGTTVNFIDLGYLLQDIEVELKKINGEKPDGILTVKRRALIDGINKIIEEKLGFKPTIRNIFTVILCNTDAFMDILLDVYAKAEQYHIDNKGELEEYRKNQGDTRLISGEKEIVYPWPSYIKKVYTPAKGDSTAQGEKEVYPGRDFPNWWECRFVEDFIRAMLDAKEAMDILDEKTEGKPGFDNYAPINPLESRMWYPKSPIKYTKKTAKNEIYQIIGERMFLTVDHSFFQPIRTTNDALNIPKIGYGNWNPLLNADLGGDNVTVRSAEIDSWNLLTSVDTLNTLSAICQETDANVFIEKIKQQLLTTGTITEKKASELKKTSLTQQWYYNDGSNEKRNVNLGYSDTDTYLVYKPNDDGYITIKEDRAEGSVKIHSNPHRMESKNLIKIIDAPAGQPTTQFAEINFPDNTETGKGLKESLKNWETRLKASVNDVDFSTSDFNKETTNYPNDLAEIFDSQKVVQFAKNQLFSTLAMAFPSKTLGVEGIIWSKWWEDKTSGSFSNQNTEAPGGAIVSNMALFTFWRDEDNNYVSGLNLFQNDFMKDTWGPNAVDYCCGYNPDFPFINKNDLQKGTTFTAEERKDGSKGDTISGIIWPGLPIYSGLITTPLWLDNVNKFRGSIDPSYATIPNGTNGDTTYIEQKNLAYLFLHSLKSTPLVKRIINDDGYFYSLSNQSDANPSLIWSLKAFNLIGGVSKVPKAWLLTLGAQLWRWKTFVGTKTVDGQTVWNKPLPSERSTANGETPTGYDPLIQPGFNSIDGQFVRWRYLYPIPDDPNTTTENESAKHNSNIKTTFSRNNPNVYLKGIYGGQNGVNYNKSTSLSNLKSVFGSNYQERPYGQIINSTGFDSYDVIAFKYYPYIKDSATYGKEVYGKLNDVVSDFYGKININYSWPFIYIAPHHIPYISPETFDDSDNGSGGVFSMVTDQWTGYQDYVTLMPKTYDKKDYNEAEIGSDPTLTDKGYNVGYQKDNTYCTRSKYEDGNLGMIIQNLPDSIKEEIVAKFENWATTEWLELLKTVDPVNFPAPSVKQIIPSKYYYYKGETSPSANIAGTDYYFMAINEEADSLTKLLTDQYWILNSTPKIWYGIGNVPTTSGTGGFFNNFDTSAGSEGFVISATQLSTYLTTFYNTYKANVQKRKNDLLAEGKEELAGLGDTILDDDDIKLSLYRTFKSLSDKWISASNTGRLFFNIRDTGTGSSCNGRGSKGADGTATKSSLASHFEYVNRVMGDIGDQAVIDMTKLNELKDNKKISLYQYLSEILTQNEYMFFPLPTYVNFGVKGVDREDIQKMFKPVFSLDDVSCGPLFLCMYVGGASRQLKMRTNVNCPLDQEVLDNIEDDSFSFSNRQKLPNEMADPEAYGKSEGYTAFKVLYGAENQNHFKNIQLDQAEFSETAESLLVIDKITQQGGTDKSGKGQNLNAMYLTRSYTCTIESLGNMMLQPMTYFDLQGVPMFSGAYIITEVRHNIKPNHATTTFKGVRQPRATLPIVTDAAVAMNISFKGVSPNDSGKSIKDLVKEATGNNSGGNGGGGGGGNTGGGNGGETAKIYAAYEGQVVIAGPAKGFGAPPNGGWVVVRHGLNQGADTFSDGNYYFFVYGHINPSVNVGDKVIQGQELGIAVWPNINADGSRCASTGLHLHLQVHQLKSKSYVCKERDCDGKIAPNPFLNQGADKSITNLGNITAGTSPSGRNLFPNLSGLIELKDFVNPVSSSNKPIVTSQMYRGGTAGNFKTGDYHGALDIAFGVKDAATNTTPVIASVDDTSEEEGSGTKSSDKIKTDPIAKRLGYIGLVS